ncbi:putative glucan endo-1,3-beta-D-glucosidase [Helianthus anomalus]
MERAKSKDGCAGVVPKGVPVYDGKYIHTYRVLGNLFERSDVPHDKQKLNETMDYACEHADCSAFADGGLCSGLGECEMASYAFNSFFQMSNQSKESCDFEGLATQVDKDPSKDQRKFNIQIKPNGHEHIDSDSPALSPFSFSSSHLTGVPSIALIGLALLVMTSLFFF